MSMTLSQFVDFIKTEANKGTALASGAILPRARLAAQKIERNESYFFMQQLATFYLATGVSYATLPLRTKRIEWLKFTATTGVFKYLHQVDGQQVQSLSTGYPTGYWQSSASRIQFDNTNLTNKLKLNMLFYRKSAWSTSLATTYTNWLLDNALDLMTAETMMMLAPYAREPKWKQLYKEMLDEGYKTLFIENEAFKQGNRDEVMIYANRGSTL